MYLGSVASLEKIPSGIDGTKATLAKMAELADVSKKSMRIRSLATEIIKRVPGKNFLGELTAIQTWVRNNIRYTRDILNVETLTYPENLLDIRHGDCDDHSMLVASLLLSIGHSARFKAIGFHKSVFSHVFTETEIRPSVWISVETTENVPIGWKIDKPHFFIVREIP